MSASRVILGLFGVLYVVLGVWCIVAPETTASSVGFTLEGGRGRSEFYVVYGGLELSMGITFLLGTFDAAQRRGALTFALISSACLAVTRGATLVFVAGIPNSTFVFFAVETALTLVAAFGCIAFRRSSAAAAAPAPDA